MDLFLVPFLYIVLIYGHFHPSEAAAGTISRRKRAVGGTDAEVNAFPYMVSLEHKEEGYFICGGSIISKYHVLTAAHCGRDLAGEEIKVRAGSLIWGINGSLHHVVTKVPHELFKLNEFTNAVHDIALLTVKEPFQFNNNVKPIKLWRQVIADELKTSEKAAALGWGVFENEGKVFEEYIISDKLKMVELPLVGKNFCMDKYKKVGGIYEGQICAGYEVAVNKDVCYGDSGGPLVLDGKQIGVAAYIESQCGRINIPSVFTEVAFYYDWITKNAQLDD